MTKLYFAPLNKYSNYIYRHLLLNHSADYVFSELIMVDKLDKAIEDQKLKIIKEDTKKTIFQIGAKFKEEITLGINTIKEHIPNVKEINLNVDCPHSTMLQTKVCGGILEDKDLLKELASHLNNECKKQNITPSIKLRIGINENQIEIDDFLNTIKPYIKKIYIHARPLRYPYTKPTIYSPLKEIKTKFNDLDITLSGDVDCFEKYQEINDKYNPDGIMIGRAALSNPLIFEQIKNKHCTNIKNKQDFDPIVKDPNIYYKDGAQYLNQNKHQIILELLQIAIKNKSTTRFIKTNLVHLLKGSANTKEIIKEINQEKPLKDIKESLLQQKI